MGTVINITTECLGLVTLELGCLASKFSCLIPCKLFPRHAAWYHVYACMNLRLNLIVYKDWLINQAMLLYLSQFIRK